MFIALLTLLSALSISGVAIFYSVIGLATIFPGAFWPVVIMGSVLEVGKLITASWLYRNWRLHTILTAVISNHSNYCAVCHHIYGYFWIPIQSTPRAEFGI
jgi:hypothetical protein